MTRYAFTNPGFWWEAVVVNLPVALFALWCGRGARGLVRR